MTNLTKIRGLQRGANPIYDANIASGTTSGGAGPASVRGFRVPLALGRSFKNSTGSVVATLTSGSLNWSAVYPGTYGNNIQVGAVVAAPAVSSIQVHYFTASGTANPRIIAYVPANTTAQQLVNVLRGDPVASQLVDTSVGTGYTQASVVTDFGLTALSGGSNGSGTDKEPGPQSGGLLGEPIFVHVTNKTTWVVDTDDQVVARALFRNKWRWVPLGPA